MIPFLDGNAGVCHDGVVGAVARERAVLRVFADVRAQRSVVCGTGLSGWSGHGALGINVARPAPVKSENRPVSRTWKRNWKVGVLGKMGVPFSVAQPELDEPFHGDEHVPGRLQAAYPLTSRGPTAE